MSDKGKGKEDMATVQLPAALVGDLKTIVDRRTEVKQALAEIDQAKADSQKDAARAKRNADAVAAMAEEGRKAQRDLEGVVEKMKPKDWDWKRSTWAACSGVLGTALAWFLHSRVPAMNQAACGITGTLAADYLGLRKGHGALMGATTGIVGIWSHENLPILEVAMAGAAYGDLIFDAGEDFMEGVKIYRIEHQEKKEKAA